ncbi:MAG: hypothetical protein XE11_0228 [Methanomicrobiales archaeon 53_19]|jgi:hypothetical protein|nr:MAG: hypothetical protein XD88_1274 [Methanocalculus sp. 52_23]KUL05073.1 MAG: hypothetical protein XE11_0228 [Methanomicrobiales archaeon 53_19]
MIKGLRGLQMPSGQAYSQKKLIVVRDMRYHSLKKRLQWQCPSLSISSL